MSLQALWALFLAHPAQAVNGLALFFGVAGAWLLLARAGWSGRRS